MITEVYIGWMWYAYTIMTFRHHARERKTGIQKTYPQKIDTLLQSKELLLASRRGIVPNFTEQDKPTFSCEELYENRKKGLSFSSIGKN